MSTFAANVLENAELAKAGVGDAGIQGTITEAKSGIGRMDASDSLHDTDHKQERYEDTPTDEELNSLRRVSGKIPWTAWTIAFVELCERFSYYGTTVVYVNFVQHPLPEGSNTGAGGHDGQSGALGRGQRMSTGLTLFNQFWAYVFPAANVKRR